MPHKTEDYYHPASVDTTLRHGDWRDDLFDNGYAVVKAAVSQEKAKYYMDKMFDWLEGFDQGFDRNDRSTWVTEKLPFHMKGGMYHGYGIPHEQFVWDARCEPGVLGAFEKLWGTDRLLASYDGINFTLPVPGLAKTEPWPHIDQSPRRRGLVCAQGILNFNHNGPEDGGLVVMKGSHKFQEAFFKEHPETIGRKTWGPEDWFGFQDDEVAWFEKRGCPLTKVCAEPGDLIIWDSRTVHYNVLPETDQIRSIMYVCYGPSSFAEQKDLDLKAELFRQRRGTTHWPHMQVYPSSSAKDASQPDPFARSMPHDNVKETDQILKLVGILPY